MLSDKVAMENIKFLLALMDFLDSIHKTRNQQQISIVNLVCLATNCPSSPPPGPLFFGNGLRWDLQQTCPLLLIPLILVRSVVDVVFL